MGFFDEQFKFSEPFLLSYATTVLQMEHTFLSQCHQKGTQWKSLQLKAKSHSWMQLIELMLLTWRVTWRKWKCDLTMTRNGKNKPAVVEYIFMVMDPQERQRHLAAIAKEETSPSTLLITREGERTEVQTLLSFCPQILKHEKCVSLDCVSSTYPCR